MQPNYQVFRILGTDMTNNTCFSLLNLPEQDPAQQLPVNLPSTLAGSSIYCLILHMILLINLRIYTPFKFNSCRAFFLAVQIVDNLILGSYRKQPNVKGFHQVFC